MNLFLIRHGETTGDVEDRYGGIYDDALTERGQIQLQQTARQLTGKGIEIIFTSPLLRARQSADIIASVIGAPIKVVEGLRERSYGVLTGLTKTEALVQYPEAVEAHKNPDNTDPEGESRVDFEVRILRAFEQVRASGHTAVAVVAHGGSLKIIMRVLGAPIPEKIGDGEIFEIKQ